MAFDTYADLKTALANFGNRTDLTNRIPEFVALAETRIYYGSQEAPFVCDPLRIRAMEQSSYTSISAREVELPTRFLQVRRFYLSGDSGTELASISPDAYWRKYFNSATSRPNEFTIEGENLLLGPAPDGTYTGQLLYYKAFAALSDDADTNWLLTNAPNVYLQGALIELFKYIRAYDKAADAEKAFAGTMNALNAADRRNRFASPWVVQSDGPTP